MYVQGELESSYPVLQWISQTWILGSNWEFGRYDTTTLGENYDVIVVAGNYRLDSLGWLALEELQNNLPPDLSETTDFRINALQ